MYGETSLFDSHVLYQISLTPKRKCARCSTLDEVGEAVINSSGPIRAMGGPVPYYDLRGYPFGASVWQFQLAGPADDLEKSFLFNIVSDSAGHVDKKSPERVYDLMIGLMKDPELVDSQAEMIMEELGKIGYEVNKAGGVSNARKPTAA